MIGVPQAAWLVGADGVRGACIFSMARLTW